jgi:hypothetical protein
MKHIFHISFLLLLILAGRVEALDFKERFKNCFLHHGFACKYSPKGMSVRSAVSDAFLRWLGASECQKLEWLDIGGSMVGDEGLRFLSACRELERLELGGLDISGVGLQDIKALQSIRYISFEGSAIEGEHIQVLSRFKSLTALKFEDTAIGDSDLGFLTELPALRKLDLSETKVTDASIPLLSTLKKLKVLVTKFSDISYSGEERLREALPGCDVNPRNQEWP